MAPNFRCKLKVHWQSCLQEKKNIILFRSRVNRHVCDVINFMNSHFELFTGDAIMNIAVFFSLLFA